LRFYRPYGHKAQYYILILNELYDQYESQLEDFWGRRDNRLRYRRTFSVFGCPVELASNDERVLAAASYSAPLYSTAPPRTVSSGNPVGYQVRFVVRPPAKDVRILDPGPPPEHSAEHIQYTGEGSWINLHFGSWGNVFADLQTGIATGVITPQLAARPDLISRGLLNTLLNNYLTARGFAMLHATGLVRNGRVLLLMAPHNSGKSTTALRLTLSGQFQLLSDSQIYVTTTESGLQLTGFPVGRGKLRRDMLPHFAQLAPLLTPEQVRDETKYVLDLHQLDSTLVYDEAICPTHIDLCLLKRNGQPKTTLHEATLEETWDAIMLNSLHYDNPNVWAENLSQIEPLVKRARLYHLEIGTEGEGIVERILEITA
jgi:hypothetical protein